MGISLLEQEKKEERERGREQNEKNKRNQALKQILGLQRGENVNIGIVSWTLEIEILGRDKCRYKLQLPYTVKNAEPNLWSII